MADKFPQLSAPDAFKNKTIIINGARGALGGAISKALGAAGANLVLNDIKVEALEEFCKSLKSTGYSVSGFCFSSTEGDQLVQEALKQHGAIHAVINAQLGSIPFKPFENLTDDDFRILFETMVIGPMNLTRAAWPHFKAQKFGRVVNFTSDGILGMPTGSTYTMTKGAIFGVNKTLAAEGAAHNIKVNCISPIAYKPPMDPIIAHFSEDVKERFRTIYTAEANVPMVLSLVSEQCEASGEVFQTAGWAVGRNVWGTVEGETEMTSMESCLKKIDRLCKKGDRKVFEPTGMSDYTEFQANYALGR